MLKFPKINLKGFFIYFLAFVFIFGIFKAIEAVRAGSLNPTAAPAASGRSLDEIGNVVTGTYDASGVSANADGNILQQLKAIKNKMGM